jgi:hypothetical protein
VACAGACASTRTVSAPDTSALPLGFLCVNAGTPHTRRAAAPNGVAASPRALSSDPLPAGERALAAAVWAAPHPARSPVTRSQRVNARSRQLFGPLTPSFSRTHTLSPVANGGRLHGVRTVPLLGRRAPPASTQQRWRPHARTPSLPLSPHDRPHSPTTASFCQKRCDDPTPTGVGKQIARDETC